MLSESKYHNLFVSKFKMDSDKLKLKLSKVISEKGNSEDVIINFYKDQFDWTLIKLKQDFKNDEHYEYIITTTYEIFIKALKEDQIDTFKLDSELEKFRAGGFIKIQADSIAKKEFVPEDRVYNLNTKYGRRRAREQALRNYENGSYEYKRGVDNIKAVFWTIVIVIAIIVFFIKQAMKQ